LHGSLRVIKVTQHELVCNRQTMVDKKKLRNMGRCVIYKKWSTKKSYAT